MFYRFMGIPVTYDIHHITIEKAVEEGVSHGVHASALDVGGASRSSLSRLSKIKVST